MLPIPDQFYLLAEVSKSAFVDRIGVQMILWPWALAFGGTMIAMPVVRRIAAACQLYDRPDAGLKPHEKPIPYLGGIAMFCGWLAAVGVAVAMDEALRFEWFWIATGSLILLLLGLLDDIRRLPPLLRLLVQVAVAGLLMYAGLAAGVTRALLGPWHGALPQGFWGGAIEVVLSGAFCALLLAGATNATNLIDGLDGLCAGISAIASVGFILACVIMPPSAPGASKNVLLVVVICCGMLGACLAFLIWNFHPASMFMGDSGSMLIGFNVAVVLLLLTELDSWRGLLAGLTIFGFPIFDTALAVSRRRLNHKPLFVGDRSHLYDQIRDSGLSVRKTVWVCYAVGLIFAGIGVAMTQLNGMALVMTFIALPLLGFVACRRFGLLRVDDAAERSNDSNV